MRPLTTLEASGLVARREIITRLHSKAFIVSMLILVVAAIVGVVVAGVSGATASKTKVAVVTGTPASVVAQLDAAKDTAVTRVADVEAADRLVRDGKADAAVAPADDRLGVKVIAKKEAPTDLIEKLSVAPTVTLLAPDNQNGLLRYLVGLGFALVFFVTAATFGAQIAQSVVEEKQTRIVELLVAAIPARALLAGKVIGNSVLAFAQIAILAAIAVIGLSVTGQTSILTALGAPIVWFAVFFVFGFVLLAAMFAATGALVSRMEDLGSTTTPVTMLIMAPYFLIIFGNSNPVLVGIMSYVPFGAPIAMPLRLFLGDAQWWEPLIALVLLAATCVGMLWLGSLIYERSLLKLGARVAWRDALAR